MSAARTGLAGWLAENKPATPTTSTNIPGCPAIDLADVQAALLTAGVDEEILDWITEIEWNEYEDIDPELLGIACGGDSDGEANDSDTGVAIGIAAVDLTDKGTFAALLANVGVATPTDQPAPALPGGTAQVSCADGACVAFWHDGDGLTLALSVIGVEDLDAAATASLMDRIGPRVLQTLGQL